MIRKSESAANTPMLQQYFAAKEEHPREVLLFRMGDFYEMFFDDARTCAEILGIALTTRGQDRTGEKIPMAGIPVRTVESYLAKLLEAGQRVAICEQVQDPKEAKGIVERQVVRVVTPGTITDESVIGERSTNYIAALVKDSGGSHGLAWLDVTTGRFVTWETRSPSALAAQLGRLSPAEVVLPEGLAFRLEEEPEILEALGEAFRSPFTDSFFDGRTARRTLTEHFGTRTLEGFGCEHLRLGIRAAGGLLRYIRDTQKVALRHISRIAAFQENRVVPIDRATRQALELTETARGGERAGTLLASFDRTATAAGGRLLREWLLAPLCDPEAIVHRQQAVSVLVENDALREQVRESLRQVHDLERIASRISYGSANARDLAALRRSLDQVPGLREAIPAVDTALLGEAAERLDDHPDLRGELARALVDEPPLPVREGGIIREGYSPELDELRRISTEGREWFARYQHREAERTGIPSLKVGFNKVFGYYVEVTNAHQDKVPGEYVRKQTLKNCERYVTPELKEYEHKVLHARERSEELEYEIFSRLRESATERIPSLQETARALAEIDVLSTLALLAGERGYTRPVVDRSKRLLIEEGRHPVVEQAGSEAFIPNSADLDEDRHLMIITGPNMAGKSTYIRQVALLVLLAQTGSFLPAKSAEIGVIDRLFTRVGASDDLTRGHSTFMVEMHETANILNNATARSLLVLDEVGRGTSTFDGVSLAWAVTEHIAEKVKARTLFATHYHELTALTRSYPAAANWNFAVKEWNEEIIFLRKIVEGGADKSYGIHVARLAGIPREVIERAKEILSNLENQSLDIDDRASLARTHRHGGDTGAAAPPPDRVQQLDLLHDANRELIRELKLLDTDRMTPMDALRYLADLRGRIA